MGIKGAMKAAFIAHNVNITLLLKSISNNESEVDVSVDISQLKFKKNSTVESTAASLLQYSSITGVPFIAVFDGKRPNCKVSTRINACSHLEKSFKLVEIIKTRQELLLNGQASDEEIQSLLRKASKLRQQLVQDQFTPEDMVSTIEMLHSSGFSSGHVTVKKAVLQADAILCNSPVVYSSDTDIGVLTTKSNQVNILNS
jgi:hypothetical protein